MSYIPTEAPFSDQQRAWLTGFLSGLQAQQHHLGTKIDVAQNSQKLPISILFGTQTGNSEELANDAAEIAQSRGYEPKVSELDAVSMVEFAQIENAIIVVSTYGEGEMPDNAEVFWQALSASTAPRLENMSYAVLGLGDTSYDEFCHAGKLIDTRLEQLGAVRLASRIDCDVDYEEPASNWLDTVLVDKSVGSENPVIAKKEIIDGVSWNKKNPFLAPLVENTLLSGHSSAKEIRHVVFDLSESGLTYEAGDALGVFPVNAKDLVQAILSRLGLKYDSFVDGYDLPIGTLLSNSFEIMTPSKQLVHFIEKIAQDEGLSKAIGTKDSLDKFLWGKDILDLLNLNPRITLSPEGFLENLKPLQHRAYSISSSSKAAGSDVHLTVAAVRWQYQQRMHKGVASTFLADRVEIGSSAGVFVSANKNFRVPADSNAPMIMVGPGTGIAPFRVFLQERAQSGAKGMNWLFFGDQHRDSDFLYENELSQMSSNGILSRLDLAFSRDQSEKVYVQNRMVENGKELFRALDNGGHFYVCGDASKMAKDVDKALHQIVAQHGGLSDQASSDYVNSLKREKRYLRDVY